MSPMTPSANEPAPRLGVPSEALLNALLDALNSERKLLDDLITQMRRQRAFVAVDDIDGVDQSTFATHRILATLGQARTRRRQLNVLLGGSEDCTLRELEEMLGDQVDERLHSARQLLTQTADMLTREVAMNRKLLREALTNTDQHVRTLVGAPAQPSTYATEGVATPASGAPRGVLVNRTA